jgi:N-acetylmuramoyl-L-alanine amidase
MRRIGAFIPLVLWGSVLAAPVEVTGMRLWAGPEGVQVIFDLSKPVEHKIFALSDPDRIVIDMVDTRLAKDLPALDDDKDVLRGIRSALRDGKILRVVLDLKRRAKIKSFLLTPKGPYGNRLVVDLDDRSAKKRQPVTSIHSLKTNLAGVVIAVDAGHGGEDPGARGQGGTLEKTVVLAIAKKLIYLIEKEPGMRPVVVREGDYYLDLRRRMEIARQHKADLFVSIHADAFKASHTTGSSVFVLSKQGASTEAAHWLAERENAADLIGGVSLEDKDEVLASVLLDLSQTATSQASMKVAQCVLAELKRVGKVHKPEVQRAGFVVLKSPDIPSILVETAFISNSTEERKLRDSKHQWQLARAIFSGIRAYFAPNALPDTFLAARKHVIARGETLSGIAYRYRVQLQTLRTYNRITDDQIRVGDILHIP